MTDERRRNAAEKALKRAADLGIPVDTDPAFQAMIESWISGEITMSEARSRYLQHIKERDGASRKWRAMRIKPDIRPIPPASNPEER